MIGRAQNAEPASAGATNRRLGLCAAAAVYVAVTLLQLLPLLRSPLSLLPSDRGDPVFVTWLLWWNAHAWPLTTRWWNAPAFYPEPGVLSFSEHLVGLAPLTTPIQWLTGSPELAYNVAFVLSFPLSAFAAHLLVRELTGRDDVAFLAGAAYGFSPYRAAHLAHLQVLFSPWLPLTLLGLHAGVRGRRWGFPAAAACWLMQGLTNGYQLLFFPLLAGLWLAWFAARRPRALAAAAGWFAAAALAVLPFLLGYHRFQVMFGMTRPLSEIEYFSSDGSALLNASHHLKLWGEILKTSAESALFPGFVILAIATAGAAWAALRGRVVVPASASRLLRWSYPAARVIAVAAGALAVASWLRGGFYIRLGFARIAVFDPVRPLVVALAAGLVSLLASRAAVSATPAAPRRSTPVDRVALFYLVGAVSMYVLSWGPSPRFLGKPFWHLGWIHAPYAYLLMLPGFDSLRVPSRFGLLWVLCLSVAAALVLARVLAPGRRATAVAAVLGCAAIAEGWFGPVPVVRSPVTQPAPWVNAVAGARAVVELPLGNVDQDLAAMLRTRLHGKPVVNGYSGYFPPQNLMLRATLGRGDVTGLETLRACGPIAVVLHTDRPRAAALQARLDSSPAFTPRGEWTDVRLYWLAPPAAAARTAARAAGQNANSICTKVSCWDAPGWP